MLVLLDLSSAFDTIDHHNYTYWTYAEWIRLVCTAKEWFASYLSDRTNRVCVLGDFSDVQVLKYGVPHGSISGPPIFNAYAQPVANIIRRFQIGYHIYADDTQLYVSFNPKSEEDIAAAKLRMTQCIAEIRSWMLSNKLMLFLIASSRHANPVSHLDLNWKSVALWLPHLILLKTLVSYLMIASPWRVMLAHCVEVLIFIWEI